MVNVSWVKVLDHRGLVTLCRRCQPPRNGRPTELNDHGPGYRPLLIKAGITLSVCLVLLYLLPDACSCRSATRRCVNEHHEIELSRREAPRNEQSSLAHCSRLCGRLWRYLIHRKSQHLGRLNSQGSSRSTGKWGPRVAQKTFLDCYEDDVDHHSESLGLSVRVYDALALHEQ